MVSQTNPPSYGYLLLQPLLLSIPIAICVGGVGALPFAWIDWLAPYSKVLSLGLSTCSLFAFPLLCTSVGRNTFVRALAWRRWFDWLQREYYGRPAWQCWIAVLVGMWLSASLLGALSEWLVSLLPEHWEIPTEDAVGTMLRAYVPSDDGIGFLLLVLEVSLLTGIVEEVFFRGYVQRIVKLWTRGNEHRAVWITSLVFSAVHGSIVGFLPRLAMGLVLGYTCERTGRLVPSILLHTLNNAIAVVILIHFD